MVNNKRPNSQSLFFSDRLTEVLNQIPQVPLTVLEAPMGYGKTTAIQAYVARTGAKALWATVGENSAARFWDDFCGVFAELDRECARKLAEFGLPPHAGTTTAEAPSTSSAYGRPVSSESRHD